MDDRRRDAGQDDRSGREQRDDDGQGQRSLTQERQGTETGGRGGTGGSGDWQGYVVPYRYYGPGYRGVGYYSVMYQGQGQGAGQSEGTGQADWWQGDQRNQPLWSQRGGWSGQGRGGFAGKGPKGYQRSDDRLRDEVSDRLMEDDFLDASAIEVQVRDGEVTLIGTVPERSMKRRAEECAEQVMGVRDVMHQIRSETEGSASTGSQGGQKAQSTGSARSQHTGNGQRDQASTSTR